MAETKDSIGTASTVEAVTQSLSASEKPGSARRDYAGAQAKRDPREIRLVRKLDIRIIVSFP
jgi:hypothetical protein